MLANVTDITGPAADCTFPGEVSNTVFGFEFLLLVVLSFP
jgi:hypothetical protein